MQQVGIPVLLLQYFGGLSNALSALIDLMQFTSLSMQLAVMGSCLIRFLKHLSQFGPTGFHIVCGSPHARCNCAKWKLRSQSTLSSKMKICDYT